MFRTPVLPLARAPARRGGCAGYRSARALSGRWAGGAVQGNIGSGKSTLIDELLNAIPCNCFPENVAGLAPFLHQAYSGDGNIDSVQLRVLADQMGIAKTCRTSISSKFPNFIERWCGSAQQVFMKATESTPGGGTHCTAAGLRLYNDMYDASGLREFPIHGYIYIRSKPEVCFERAERRARDSRPSETGIRKEYIQRLDELYTEYIDFLRLVKTPVLVIDNNGAGFNDYLCEKTMKMIAEFMESPDFAFSPRPA